MIFKNSIKQMISKNWKKKINYPKDKKKEFNLYECVSSLFISGQKDSEDH